MTFLFSSVLEMMVSKLNSYSVLYACWRGSEQTVGRSWPSLMQAFRFLWWLEGRLIWEILSGISTIWIGLASKFLDFSYFYGRLGWISKFRVACSFICAVFQLEIPSGNAACAWLLGALMQIQWPFFIILIESHWSDLLTFHFGQLGGNWFGLFLHDA